MFYSHEMSLELSFITHVSLNTVVPSMPRPITSSLNVNVDTFMPAAAAATTDGPIGSSADSFCEGCCRGDSRVPLQPNFNFSRSRSTNNNITQYSSDFLLSLRKSGRPSPQIIDCIKSVGLNRRIRGSRGGRNRTFIHLTQITLTIQLMVNTSFQSSILLGTIHIALQCTGNKC